MKRIAIGLVAALATLLPVTPALAWFHAGGWHAGGAGGWHAGGWHASGGYGGWHAAGWHGGAYGAHYVGYHPPAVFHPYAGCYGCGAGAAVAAGVGGLAVGAAIGAASANASAANAYAAGVAAGAAAQPGYAIGLSYASLPGNCAYTPIGGTNYYQCNGVWFVPSYGAGGVSYRVVPAP